MAKTKALPKVSIIDRRMAHPFGFPSQTIELKEGQWAIRWFSEAVRTGRIYQAQQLGWGFVLPEELRGTPTDIGGIVVDGRVVRGEAANREVLMKMPRVDFERIQQAKADANLAELKSTKKTKEDAANRAAKELGDEAAESIYNSNMEVMDERRSYDLDGDAPTT